MSHAVILGSSRSKGDTRKICEHVLKISDVAALYDLNDFDISYFDYEHKNQYDDFRPLIRELLKFDTFVFATPVYWYTMSAQLKTFLDRFSDLLKIDKPLGRQLRGKNMKVICCSSTEEVYPEFWSPFIRSAEYLGMHYKGHVHTYLKEGKINEEVQRKLSDLMDSENE